MTCALHAGCGARSGLDEESERGDAGSAIELDAGSVIELDAGPAAPCEWTASEPVVAHRATPPFGELHVGALTAGRSGALLVWYAGTAIFGGDPRVRYSARAFRFDGAPLAAEQELSNEPIVPGGFGSPRMRAAALGDGYAVAPWLARDAALAPGVLVTTDARGAPSARRRVELPLATQWDELFERSDGGLRLFARDEFGATQTVDLDAMGAIERSSEISATRPGAMQRAMREDDVVVELRREPPFSDEPAFTVQAYDFDGVPQWPVAHALGAASSAATLLSLAVDGDTTWILDAPDGSSLRLEALDAGGERVLSRELALPMSTERGSSALIAVVESGVLVVYGVSGRSSRELFVALVARDGAVDASFRSVWRGAAPGTWTSMVAVPGGVLMGGTAFDVALQATVQALRCAPALSAGR